MKKLIIFVLPILLASCFWPNKAEIQNAKETLLDSSWTTISLNNSNSDKTWTTNIIQEEKSYFEINYLTDDKSISLENISNIENIKDNLDIKWIVLNSEIDKIKVIFQNKTSTFPVDNYELKTYKKWNKDFLYRAYKKYAVLDFWLNEYTFEWYVKDKIISSVKLDLFIVNSKKLQSMSWDILNSSWTTINTLSWDILENLLTNEITYWSPKINDDETFNYSNIDNFTWSVNNELSWINCVNLWDYLKQNYTWYYWNTCRPIIDENNFSVYVLYLSWNEYKYEKQYISQKLWIYGKILLDSWSWITSSELQIKSDELKSHIFDTINSDKLFQDLLK